MSLARCASGLRPDTLVQRPIILVKYQIDLILGIHLFIVQRVDNSISFIKSMGFPFVHTFFVTNFPDLDVQRWRQPTYNTQVLPTTLDPNYF